MRKIINNILITLAISCATLLSFGNGQAVAAGDCGKSFLTFKPWFNGLCENGNIVAPDAVGGLPTFVWIIVLNILAILFQLAGYITVGFLIYGGYQYVLARGSSSGLEKAKKTIQNAVIGLVIVIMATFAVNTVVNLLANSGGTGI